MVIKELDNYFLGRSTLGLKVKEIQVTLTAEPLSISAASLGFKTLKEVTPIVLIGATRHFVTINAGASIIALKIDTEALVVNSDNLTGTGILLVKGL